MGKEYHHFEVTKNGDLYQIVLEGDLGDAVKEMKKTFGFDRITYLRTTSERWRDMHGNKRIGQCTIRGFWQKNRQVKRHGAA